MVNNVVHLNREMKINMPNWDTSNIAASGHVDLPNGLHLQHVLIVPNFTHNLISGVNLPKMSNAVWFSMVVIMSYVTRSLKKLRE